MLVFVSLIYEQGINTHIIEVLNVISSAVEHFHCLYLCILQSNGTFLFIVGSTFLACLTAQSCKFFLQQGDFTFSLSGNHTLSIGVGFSHLFKDKHLFLNLLLYKCHLPFLAVGNKLKG